MRKSDAIKWAGSVHALATICRRTRQAVWTWGAIIPEEHAYRLHHLSRGEIPLREDDYQPPPSITAPGPLQAAPASVTGTE